MEYCHLLIPFKRCFLSISASARTPNAQDTCESDDDLLQMATPYILPCVLEFCILGAAAFYSLWVDVAFYSTKTNDKGPRRSVHMDLPDMPVHLTEINFHKTHRGLFTGFIVLAAVAIAIIMFFSYLSTSDDDDIPLLIYTCTDMTLFVVLIIAVSVTWCQIAFLKYSHIRKITVDEFLLFVAMTGLFGYNICEAFATVQALIDGSTDLHVILGFSTAILCMVLALMQTCFIVEGYSRQPERSMHLKEKPGRGGVTFLLIANISLWLLRSFILKHMQVKEMEPEQNMFSFLVWQIITYGLVPFLVFYHFQAAACLAHIWGRAYRKEGYREATPSVRSEDPTEAISIVPTSGEIRIVELKRRIRKSTGVTEEDTVFSPVSVV